MRAILTSDCGYGGMRDVKFPIAVAAYESVQRPDTLIIHNKELERIGVDMCYFRHCKFWNFSRQQFINIGE